MHVFKGRLILVLLENDLRISQMYRFMKGEYFKAEQVCFFQSQNRLFQIGWKKKNAIRELTKVITSRGSRDEYNLEELECETAVVGKL